MGIFGFGRRAFGVGLAVALLAGCGGAQQAGTAGVMPQGAAIARLAAHGKSWMLPWASGSDLLYTVGFTRHQSGYVRVYSYPQGDLAGEFYLDGYARGGWVCSDANGNVFFPALGGIGNTNPEVLEYAHGGTTPIATLSDSNYNWLYPSGCSIDPTSGNLAVANNASGGSGHTGNVAIFHKAQGTPTLYVNPNFTTYYYACGYDNQGNLFVDGFGPGTFAELPNGSSTFINIAIPKRAVAIAQVQWDGKHITTGLSPIYRLAISGSSAKIVGKTHLASATWDGIYWLEGSTVIMPMGKRAGKVGLWNYPAGGGAFKIINILDGGIDAETVSVAPSGSHIHR